MCGRYNIIPNATWPREFSLSAGSAARIDTIKPNYNVCPSADVPIVRYDPGSRQMKLSLAYWGLVPFWSKQRSIAYRMINARAESVAEKPAYRESFRWRRCVIPANGFFEWKRSTGSGPKQPYLFTLQAGTVFGFAGLWDCWKDPGDDGSLVSCTIMTTRANSLMQDIHDRMPVILARENYSKWLDPVFRDPGVLLRPCSSKRMRVSAVSTHVNNPRNNDIRCIQPLEGQGIHG